VADEWVAELEVDVIGDQHQVAGGRILVQGARGIGGDQRLAAEQLQRADHRHDGLRRVPLVQMHASLQTRDLLARQRAEHESTGVALDAGDGEAGQLRKVHHGRVLDPVAEPAEPGAEHEAHGRGVVGGVFTDDVERLTS